jgi:D-3-phosphoglycerate dehydrogenase / 2-oxoglutarate reductase
MKKIFVATYPFGSCDPLPRNLIEEMPDWEVSYNSLGRRLKAGEVGELIKDVHGVIAGTEPYSEEELSKAKNLEVISRVGVGLDSIDFKACAKRNIKVAYTPEAPAEGVADLTVAQIINLLRGILKSHRSMEKGLWERIMGRLVNEVKIGVLGVGRIGGRVIKRLNAFGADIYANDLEPNIEFGKQYNVKWVDKDTLFKTCDVVTIHIPMNDDNFHFVGLEEMTSMKEGAFLINTSRGPIVDEKALESIVLNKHLGGVALDVFEKEPYEGPLTKCDNVILTAHIAASAQRSRYLMELGAAKNCINVLTGLLPSDPIPEEYWK